MKRFSIFFAVAAALASMTAEAADRDIARATATSAAVQEAERRVARECGVADVRQAGRSLFYRVTVDCDRAGRFIYDVTVRAIPFGQRTVYRAISISAVGGPR